MSAWSQLPNAALIDWVIKSVKDNPEVWAAAWDAAPGADWTTARDVAWSTARDVTSDLTRDAAWNESWDAVNKITYAAKNVLETNTRAWASTTVCRSLIALVAYDDCDQYLQMTYEQLHAWTILSETPQAMLLLPMKWVQEDIILQRILQKDKVCLG